MLVSSVLLVLEASRNIVRLARMGALKPADYKACLDRLHLRTALWFQSEGSLDRFVTMDTAQAEAARELGLPTGPA